MISSISSADPALNFSGQFEEKTSLNKAKMAAGQIAKNLSLPNDSQKLYQNLSVIAAYLHENFEINGSPTNLPKDQDLNFVASWILQYSKSFQDFAVNINYHLLQSDLGILESNSPSANIVLLALYNFSNNESFNPKKIEFSSGYEELLNQYIQKVIQFAGSEEMMKQLLSSESPDPDARDIIKNYISWYSVGTDEVITHLYSLLNTDTFYKNLVKDIEQQHFLIKNGATKV